MRGFDDGTCEPRNANAVRAHLQRHELAVGALHLTTHGGRVLGPEVENMTNFDPACRNAPLLWHFSLETGRVVHLFGRGILCGPGFEDARQIAAEIGIGGWNGPVDQILIAKHLALAGFSQDDELVTEIAADRPCIGAHRHRFQPHTGERAQVGHKHAVIGGNGGFRRQVERIGVLHQELAPAHHAKPGTHFVAELPLDIVEVLGQVLVALDRVAHDHRNDFFRRGPKQHIAVMPVGDSQHLFAIGFVASALSPQICRLDRRHQHFDGTGPVLLFAHDGADFLQDA